MQLIELAQAIEVKSPSGAFSLAYTFPIIENPVSVPSGADL